MSLSQEDIDKAIDDQATYWSAITDRCDYFKKCNLSKKNLDEVSKLETRWIVNDIEWAMKPSLDGYEHHSRYRLNSIITDHISTVFCHVYDSLKLNGTLSDTAIVIAEYTSAGASEYFKRRFP